MPSAISTKPEILLLGGAWHVPESYSKLTNMLKTSGFEVHVPHLPSTRGDPTADLYTDTEYVRAYAEKLVDSGKTLITLMHSYGGQLGTNSLYGLGVEARSAKGLPGGISDLVYLCAFAISEGQSMSDIVAQFGHEEIAASMIDIAEDFTCVHRDPKYLVGEDRGEASEEEYQAYLSSFVRWNAKCMVDKLANCAWRDIPTTYLITAQDGTVSPDYQRHFIERMQSQGPKIRSFELQVGHCPNITATSEVVKMVETVAAGYLPAPPAPLRRRSSVKEAPGFKQLFSALRMVSAVQRNLRGRVSRLRITPAA